MYEWEDRTKDRLEKGKRQEEWRRGKSIYIKKRKTKKDNWIGQRARDKTGAYKSAPRCMA